MYGGVPPGGRAPCGVVPIVTVVGVPLLYGVRVATVLAGTGHLGYECAPRTAVPCLHGAQLPSVFRGRARGPITGLRRV